MHATYDGSRSSLIGLLRARAADRARDVAFTFLSDGEAESARLSYGELDLQARAIAVHLRQVAEPGDRCLLLHQDGLGFLPAFFGCLYAGLVAVPVPAPEPGRLRRTSSRVRAVAEDASPSIVLTSAALLPAVREALEPGALPCLTSDEVDPSLGGEWEPPAAGDLAYLQYTSGSTSAPKGVMVSHANVLENSARIRGAWGYGPDSVAVMWVPHFHDDGLVHGLVQPLFSGFPSYLLPPAAVVQSPLRWLRAISRYRATHSGGPNFVYALAARKVRPEEREGLDLASWRVAYNAAEPIHAETLERFVRAFEPSGFRWSTFYPSFGLAEATLLVTTRDRATLPALLAVRAGELEEGHRVVPAGPADRRVKTVVGCGRAVEGTALAVVDPATGARCAAGEVGEVWISNPCVAGGYWNRPEETRETFGARTADHGEGPFLRTGDLGFLADGELYITGRLKDLIILRGRNHYPQDLELAAERSHPALRAGCGAAFSVDVDGEERLVLVQEVDAPPGADLDRVIESIRRQLAEDHDLPVHAVALVRPRTIPKTSSGKIQRGSCRRAFLAGELEVVHAWTAPALKVAAARPEAPHATVGEQEASRRRADELLGWLRELGAARINSRLIDERRCIPPHIVLELGNRGLLGMQVQRSHGGIALGYRDAVRIYVQLAAIDLTLAAFVSGHNGLGVRPVERHADAALRDELLPMLASGREIAAFALTEPGAGSNPRAISARAQEDGSGGWQLFGHKIWTGSAPWAGAINVFTQHPEGLTGFVVRQGSPGLRIGPEALTMGVRGMVQSSVYFDGVRVDRRHLLGELGAGLEVAQDAMMHARLFLGAIGVGGMKRCAQWMLRYASRRQVSTGRLLDNPVSLVRLDELTASIAALESLVLRVADLLDAGHPAPAEAFLACKIAGSELLWRAADDLMQMLGGRGYIETNLIPQLLRDARMFRIVEGPTETLAMFLGARASHEGEELRRFLAEGLGAPAVAERLREAAGAIAERWHDPSPFTQRQAGLRWSHALLGEAVVAAALWAAAEGASGGRPSPALRRAIGWARGRFEQIVARALARSPEGEIALQPDAAEDEISAYARDIGDVEQSAAGEDWSMDPLLLGSPEDHQTARGGPAPQAQAVKTGERSVSRSNGKLPEETISAWLVQQIAQQVEVDEREVDPRKPFAFYGLDSITAVTLLEKLGAWLGQRITPTLAWAYPTIESLARHLAGGDRPSGDASGPRGVLHG